MWLYPTTLEATVLQFIDLGKKITEQKKKIDF